MSQIHRTLRRGSQGEDVRFLQRILTDLGFYRGPVDGIFGSSTEAAVRQFQSSRHIGVDGIVGPQTRAALSTTVRPEEIIASDWVWLDLEPGPEATQASGVALVNPGLRQLHLYANGLPQPEIFGNQFNTYRAWLLNNENRVITTLRLTNCPSTDIWVGSGGIVINEQGTPTSVIVTPEANDGQMPTGVEVLGGELDDGLPVWPIGLEKTKRAPESTGFAFINQAKGLLAVFASGLPEPKELGRDPELQKRFDTYGVVLRDQHTGEPILAGSLLKCLPGVWVGIFRLEEGLAVDRLQVIAWVEGTALPLDPVVVLAAHIIPPKKPIPDKPLG